MSYEKRRVGLMNCDCTIGCYPEETVHCENSDGKMRCEICGRIKE